MNYILSYTRWNQLHESTSQPQQAQALQDVELSAHQERLVKRFIRKMERDDSIADLIDNKEDLANVAPEEITKLAKNLNVDEVIVQLWISNQIDDSEFIETIAKNLVASGLSRRERKQAISTAAPVAQLADIASGQKMLRLGSTGEDVKAIQQKLYELGFMEEEPSGKFDQATDKAVREFQTSKKIGVDGIVGPITYSNLYGTKLATKVDLSSANYDSIVKSVIDELEGGYYHPKMMKENPGKFAAYGSSGETMFGLDRFAGHGLYYSTPRLASTPTADLENIESGKYQYKTPEAKEFWETIDAADAKNKWSWGYRGGADEEKLATLAGKIMRPHFESMFSRYLSPASQEIVKNTPALMYHFVYGTWNGEGWFKKFANDINSAVASGTTDPSVLTRIALDSRTKEGLRDGSSPNRLIAQGGEKIEKMFGLA